MVNGMPVYITDIIGEAAAATNAALRSDADSWLAVNNRNINYVYGSEEHVTQQLRQIKDDPKAAQNGITKYPMIALMMPVRTRRGNSDGYYGEVVLPAVYIATLSDNKRLPPAKYADNLKPVLFPVYYSFLQQLAMHKSVVNEGGSNAIVHDVMEYPADVTDKANTVFTDFLDIIVMLNVTFTIKQQPVKSCAKQIITTFN